MICDKITFAGETILTIYHRGFIRDKGANRLQKITKVGRFNLRFEETVINEQGIHFPNKYALMRTGLLETKSDINPYGGSACAFMKHYVAFDKPKRLFSLSDGKFELSIPIDYLQQINSFVERYTGLEIAKNPIFYGDTFVFSCHERNYRANEDVGIIVSNVKSNTTIFVNFKKNGVIVSAKIVRIDGEKRDVYINADTDWTYHDIKIFEDDKLIFFDKDVSYMRRISMNMEIVGTANHVRLKTFESMFKLQDQISETTSHIGDPIDQAEDLLNESNRDILRRLKENQDNNRTTFISPNEYSKAFRIIAEVMQSARDELWIFDPYFSDINGWNTELDFLRILAHCNAKHKNIIFCVSDPTRAYNTQQVKTNVMQDSEIQKALLGKNNLGITLYQSKAPIHDRFIITKDNNGSFGGVAIGTSLNSIGRNHFCIFELESKSAMTILENLQSWLNSNNIVAKEGM